MVWVLPRSSKTAAHPPGLAQPRAPRLGALGPGLSTAPAAGGCAAPGGAPHVDVVRRPRAGRLDQSRE